MKFIYAILSLICFVLAHKSLAKSIYVEPNTVRLINPLLGVSYANCVIHCVQPVGQESEENSIQTRGIISNYGTLYDCLKKCNEN
jgi:hypothetical protein